MSPVVVQRRSAQCAGAKYARVRAAPAPTLQARSARRGAALADEPAFAEAHNTLGAVLATAGRRAEAIAEYRAALRLKPDYANA